MKINSTLRVLIIALVVFFTKTTRAQNVIDEDFLDNIEVNAKALWEEKIPEFATNSVPEKYKKESAIVFGFKRSVTIDKKSRTGFLSKGERSLLFFENVRFKIKLNDRNAVKAFTEVYFRYNDKTDGFSARISKPDGTVQTVSLNQAVGVESLSSVPEFFKSFFDQQNGENRTYYKVAVPDLLPGDILEYVTTTKSKLDVKGTGYIEFTPQYEVCNKGYPVLFNQIAIETDEKSFFKSLSLNGAPSFKKEAASDPEFFKYVFTDYDRGVEKDVNFINTYQVYPLTKFQVIYANNEKVKGALIGVKGEIKSAFTKEELAKRAWEDYEQVGDSYFRNYGTVQKLIDAAWSELKRLGYKSATEERYIRKMYYKLRNIVVNSDRYLSDKTAAYIFGSLLFQRDIKSELVICVSNSIGKLSNVLFDEEIRYAVKVNDKLYFNFTDHSNPGELIENLLGAEAYIIYPPEKNGTQQIKPLVLPDATIEDNTANYTINTSLDSTLNILAVSRTNTFTGINKAREINTALSFTTYMVDDYANYGGSSPTSNMSGTQQVEYYKSLKAFKDEYAIAKNKSIKNELEREFQQKVTYKDFSITSDGRTLENKELRFREDFELQGMVRKAGRKYLVNIPGLVGGQLQIKKEERERKYDINVGYARSLNWVINFKIPAGYTADGLKELNTEVNNEAGTYSCAAEQKEDTVILTIKKVYKKAAMAKDNWPAMLAFVDAAYNNSFKYLLLKPKN